MIADAKHAQSMKNSLGEIPSRVEVKSLEDMRAFNKDKKRLKRWQKGH